MKLERARIFVGSSRRNAGAIVIGDAFGASLLCVNCSAEEALDEWDERHGQRVDVVADAADLADYDGATVAEQVENARNAGDIRTNDGGTTVWVDHYEWLREFPTVREAGAYFRGVTP